jgi:hypothetical protein
VSYEEYYRRIKEMGASERLRDEEIKKLLADRPQGEKAYRRVSSILMVFIVFIVGRQENWKSES